MRDQETPVRIGLRGGAGRNLERPNQTVMSEPRRLHGKRIFRFPKVTLFPWTLAPAYLVRDNDRARGGLR